MQLAKFTDYALRVLMHLSVAQDYALSTRQITDIHDASFNHMAKVTQWLSREGYVASTRGRGGGLRLAKDPADINIGQVVRALESDTGLVECLGPNAGSCCLAASCGLTGALVAAQEAFFAVLDSYTLARLAPEGGAMTQLLVHLNSQQG